MTPISRGPQSVNGCTALSASTKASWQAFYAGVKIFTQQSAAWVNTGTQADQGQALQRELYAWQQKLSATCPLTVPSINPDAPKGPIDYNAALKWAGIIVGVVGVAYVTTEVVSTVRLFKSPAKG